MRVLVRWGGGSGGAGHHLWGERGGQVVGPGGARVVVVRRWLDCCPRLPCP